MQQRFEAESEIELLREKLTELNKVSQEQQVSVLAKLDIPKDKLSQAEQFLAECASKVVEAREQLLSSKSELVALKAKCKVLEKSQDQYSTFLVSPGEDH